jgi:hypothetical protein
LLVLQTSALTNLATDPNIFIKSPITTITVRPSRTPSRVFFLPVD